jgi:hypothetical protein
MPHAQASGPSRLLFLLVVLNIAGGLTLEALGALRGWDWAEPLVGVLTTLHLGVYLWRPPRIGATALSRTLLLTCLVLATGGELILSAVWGLYTYRESLLPAFVPPGHVLLFMAGLAVAEHERCGPWVSWLVPALAVPLLGWQLVHGLDALSVPLLAIFLACLRWGRERKLYAVMFVLALLLELYGTALGTWRWGARVPGLDLSSANPPLAAGVFYALLDLLTVRLALALARPSRPPLAVSAPPPSAPPG